MKDLLLGLPLIALATYGVASATQDYVGYERLRSQHDACAAKNGILVRMVDADHYLCATKYLLNAPYVFIE